MNFHVVNIVVSGSLGKRIDLDELVRRGVIEYNPEYYHGGYLPLGNNIKATIYRSGKYIIPGIKNLEDIDSLFETMKRKLSNYLDVDKITPPKIQNLVASGELDLNDIHLDELAMRIAGAEYNPEQFPGIVIKIPGAGTALLFSTGRFVIAGAKSIDDVERIIKKLRMVV